MSCWDHSGDHGLQVEEFAGYGVSPIAWRNRKEWQGPEWDNSRLRSSLTAALWHVGFPSPNFDECQVYTLSAVYGEDIDVHNVKPSTASGRNPVALPKFLTRERGRGQDYEW